MTSRREFITVLGGSAAWPLVARAQQREEIRRVGVLMGLEADNPEGQSALKALRQAFQELGRVDGRNLQLEIRWSGGDPVCVRWTSCRLRLRHS